MSFRIPPESGIPVVAGTVQRVTHLEQQTKVVKERMQDYSNKISFNPAKFLSKVRVSIQQVLPIINLRRITVQPSFFEVETYLVRVILHTFFHNIGL